jgi:hypothetical protein
MKTFKELVSEVIRKQPPVRNKTPKAELEFNMLTISKIDKNGNIIAAAKVIRDVFNGKQVSANNLSYLFKEKINDEDEKRVLEQYSEKIKALYKSSSLKKFLLAKIEKDINGNDINDKIDPSIKEWVMGILSKMSVDLLLGFDGYKLYTYLKIENKSDFFSSKYGNHETRSAIVDFDYDKKYTKTFNLGTTGTSWE